MKINRILILLVALLPFVASAEIISTKINVLGKVNQPGQFIVHDYVTVIDAIALAGGMSRMGDVRAIKVRKEGKDGRVSIEVYNLKMLLSGEQKNARLDSGDTVYVEEKLI